MRKSDNPMTCVKYALSARWRARKSRTWCARCTQSNSFLFLWSCGASASVVGDSKLELAWAGEKSDCVLGCHVGQCPHIHKVLFLSLQFLLQNRNTTKIVDMFMHTCETTVTWHASLRDRQKQIKQAIHSTQTTCMRVTSIKWSRELLWPHCMGMAGPLTQVRVVDVVLLARLDHLKRLEKRNAKQQDCYFRKWISMTT